MFHNYEIHNKMLKVESKDKIKKRLGTSPDLLNAVIMAPYVALRATQGTSDDDDDYESITPLREFVNNSCISGFRADLSSIIFGAVTCQWKRRGRLSRFVRVARLTASQHTLPLGESKSLFARLALPRLL